MAAVLGALASVPFKSARNGARLQLCLGNLRQVSRAVLLYANDHHALLPGAIPNQQGDAWWWYKEQVKSYAGLSGISSTNDRVFACPMDRGYSDPRPFWQSARFDFTSYVFNGVTLLGTPHIAGWNIAAIQEPPRTLLVMEWAAHAPLSWHGSKTGRANAPFYCDAEAVTGFVDGHASLTAIYYDGYNAAYTRDPISGYDYRFSGR